jgi:signal transduction histidine kinase
LDAARRRAADARAVDAVLVVLCAGLTALALKTPWSPLPPPVIMSSGLAGSLAVWWHRRRPVAVTVAGAAAHLLSGNPGPLLVGLFSGAATRRFRWVPVLACAGTIGFAGLGWIEDGAVGFSGVGGTAILTAAVLAVGAYAGTQRALLASLRDRSERAEAEHHLRVEQARAGERARIAREMHDVLAHKMSLIALHAGALELDHTSDPSRVGEAATLIGATAREALDELRSVLGLLRSGGEMSGGTASGGEESGGEMSGGEMSGASGLRDQFADIGLLITSWERAGVQVELRDTVGQMPATIGRAAYRLVQEGLTNAHRHAAGTTVVVTITGGHGHDVIVSVVNGAADGGSRAGRSSGHRGPAAPPGSGTGLVGLGERLRLVGGTLVAEHHGAGGWKLEGRLPWPDDVPGARRHAPVDGSEL